MLCRKNSAECWTTLRPLQGSGPRFDNVPKPSKRHLELVDIEGIALMIEFRLRLVFGELRL